MKVLLVLGMTAAVGTWGVITPTAEEAPASAGLGAPQSQPQITACANCQVAAFTVTRFPMSDYR